MNSLVSSMSSNIMLLQIHLRCKRRTLIFIFSFRSAMTGQTSTKPTPYVSVIWSPRNYTPKSLLWTKANQKRQRLKAYKIKNVLSHEPTSLIFVVAVDSEAAEDITEVTQEEVDEADNGMDNEEDEVVAAIEETTSNEDFHSTHINIAYIASDKDMSSTTASKNNQNRVNEQRMNQVRQTTTIRMATWNMIFPPQIIPATSNQMLLDIFKLIPFRIHIFVAFTRGSGAN